MAVSYPLSFPSGQATPAQITLSVENTVAVSTSPFTHAQQQYVHPGQRWLASVTLPPMKRDWAESWISFLIALRGRYGYFLLSDPNAYNPQGAVSGTVLVNGSGQTGDTLIVDGVAPSLTNAFKAGDYIQLGSGASARLHKILADASSDGTGSVSLDIWPNLRSSPADNDPVTYVGASGLFKLTNNVTSWNINSISSYGISFDCVEYVW